MLDNNLSGKMRTYQEGPPLRSQFLLDTKAAFLSAPRLWVKQLEFEELGDERLSREALVVASRVRLLELSVYQQLTLWGDQIAVFSVREDVRKRLHRVILRLEEFALFANPMTILETFHWTHSHLHTLDAPPGESQDDRGRLRAIEERWLMVSRDEAQ